MKTIDAWLRDHPVFHGMPVERIRAIAECATQTSFAPGQLIFREGEIADRFYLIKEGQVAIETVANEHRSLLVQILGDNELVGWSWLFPPYVLHFQARAVEQTSVLAFNGAHLLNLCERDHAFGCDLMRRIVQILIRRLQCTRDQLVCARRRNNGCSRASGPPVGRG